MSRPGTPDFSRRMNYPFLTGAMLAVNAIPDCQLLIDGPDCLIQRAAELSGRHDLRSTLLADGTCRRIWFTGITPDSVVDQVERRFLRSLSRAASRPGAARVLASAMPLAALPGTDYERLVRSLPSHARARTAWLRPLSLSRDWLAGFDGALEALARTVRPARTSGRPSRRVAVVGMFPHRLEADERANRDEVCRLLGALGLEVAAVWPSGRPFRELEKVREAAVIISLPYARGAARALAAASGARLVETGVPFGLAASRRWLLKVGDALGRRKAAERTAAAELKAVVPDLQWAVQGWLTGKRIVYAGEPHLWEGLRELLSECGAHVPLAVLLSSARTAGYSRPPAGTEVLYEPAERTLEFRLRGLAERGEVDLLIANSEFCSLADPRLNVLELGYPSDFSHSLHPTPYLGFRGAAAFLERAVRVFSQAKLLSIRRAYRASRRP